MPLEQCSSWMHYDQTRKMIEGAASVLSSIPFNETLGRFFQQYLLKIRAADTSDYSCNAIILITIEHCVPKPNPLKSLQSQLDAKVRKGQIKLKPFVNIDLKLFNDTFIITSKITKYLQYSAQMVVLDPSYIRFDESMYQNLKALFRQVSAIVTGSGVYELQVNTFHWIHFEQEAFKFYGTPLQNDRKAYLVQLTCFDGYASAFDYMIVNITNTPPQPLPGLSYKDQYFTLGFQYVLALEKIFHDRDGDPIYYAAYSQLVEESGWHSVPAPIYDFGDYWVKYQSRYNILQLSTGQEAFLAAIGYPFQTPEKSVWLKIIIQVSDLVDTSNITFSVFLSNHAPYRNPQLSIQAQF